MIETIKGALWGLLIFGILKAVICLWIVSGALN